MEVEIVARSNYRGYLQRLTPIVSELLNLDRYDGTLLIVVDRHFVGNDGVTIPLDLDGCYIVVLQPDRPYPLGVTLCHELVHVQQIASGRLRTGGGKNRWCGRTVSKRTPYLEQPWERLAFGKQELLFRRALDLM